MAKSTLLRLVRDASVPELAVPASEPTHDAPESSESGRFRAEGLNDDQVVDLVLGGDKQAFEALYRRHAAFAINLAVRLQGSAADVEDVVHDAFIRAHGRLAELRDPGAFRAWLGSIVVRLVRTRLRRERLGRALGFGVSREAADLEALVSYEASPEARAELAQVYALLTLMPTDCRIAWALRFIERHRLEEVAQLTDCSLATAKRRIARAQQFIDQHFVNPVRGVTQ
jgi:RNA polymerase sigma-70 factor (ECF subfamily)